jgi:hypothetical protein
MMVMMCTRGSLISARYCVSKYCTVLSTENVVTSTTTAPLNTQHSLDAVLGGCQ